MNRYLLSAPIALAALVAAGSANASRVGWAVGIDVPAFGAVVANAPAYYAPPPRYVAAPPRYYEEPIYSAPVYVSAPVFVAPRPRLWLPPLPRLPWAWGHEHGRHDVHIDYRR